MSQTNERRPTSGIRHPAEKREADGLRRGYATVTTQLPEKLKEVLDSRSFAHLTTVDADGSPQSSAMWIMRDGERIVLNTAEGRRKWHNLQRDPRVSISVSKDGEPYENWSIQGRVVEMRTADGIDTIDALARKYLDGVDKYPWLSPGQVRVTIIVEPTRVAGNH